MIVGTADSLTQALFSLEEPWQGRFLDLVARLATRGRWGGQQPTPAEVTYWLGVDPGLYLAIRMMLHAWHGPEG